MKKWVSPRFLICLAAAFFIGSQLSAKDCVDKTEDAEWCVEGTKLEGYQFSPREFKMKLDLNSQPFLLQGKTRFTALINLQNIKIRVNKKSPEDTVNIAGYFSRPDYENPDIVIIFVKSKERKKQIENDIETARKEFAQNCFGCKQLGFKDPGPGPVRKMK